MGFLKNLFGGEKEKGDKGKGDRAKKPPEPKAKPARGAAPAPSGGPDQPAEEAPAATADARLLARQVGAAERSTRVAAAKQLAELQDRSAMRPLMSAYMNYGDHEVLAALATYGNTLSTAVLHDAADTSLVGQRRARVLDMLGATGDPNCLPAARESVDDPDFDVHVRACLALAKLGDVGGIDLLEHDLHLTDPAVRNRALSALRNLDDLRARKAIDDHLDRYLADAGAIPERIIVSAPRLADRGVSLSAHVCDHIKASPHDLTVVVGSEAINMATNRRDVIQEALPDVVMEFTTRRMAPEEQIAALLAARDHASADPGQRAGVLGALPGPLDAPSLPHFLTRGARAYTAKIIFVDPHEVRVVMDWYHYVQDKAEVPTDFEIVSAVSTPDASAISDEEYQIYELLPPEKKDDFIRALIAHM